MAQEWAGELWHSDRQVNYGKSEAGELWHSDRRMSYGTAIGG